MPRRTYKPEEIVAKLRQVDVLLAQGKALGESIKTIGVTDTTYHRWRNEFGSLKLDQVKRLNDQPPGTEPGAKLVEGLV